MATHASHGGSRAPIFGPILASAALAALLGVGGHARAQDALVARLVELDGTRARVSDASGPREVELGCAASEAIAVGELIYAACGADGVARARLSAQGAAVTDRVVYDQAVTGVVLRDGAAFARLADGSERALAAASFEPTVTAPTEVVVPPPPSDALAPSATTPPRLPPPVVSPQPAPWALDPELVQDEGEWDSTSEQLGQSGALFGASLGVVVVGSIIGVAGFDTSSSCSLGSGSGCRNDNAVIITGLVMAAVGAVGFVIGAGWLVTTVRRRAVLDPPSGEASVSLEDLTLEVDERGGTVGARLRF